MHKLPLLSQTHSLWTADFKRLCLVSFFMFSSYHLLTPILPLYLSQVRGFHGETIGFIMAGLMIASMLVRPWIGFQCDHGSKTHLMQWGALLLLFANAGYPFAHDFYSLIGLRVIHGIAYALIYTGTASYLVEHLPPEHKAEGLSHYGNAIKLAMAFSPAVGIWLTTQVNSFFNIGCLLACLLTLLCAASIWQVTPGPVRILPPVKPRELISNLLNKDALFPGLIMALASLAFGALMPYIPLLSLEKHLTETHWFYTLYAASLITSRWLTGPISDTYGRASVLIPGLSMVALSLLLLASANSTLLFLVATVMYGLAAGTVQPSLMAMAADKNQPETQGSAMATFTLFNDIGIAGGMFVMATLGDLYGYVYALQWIAAGVGLAWLLLCIHTWQRTRKMSIKTSLT